MTNKFLFTSESVTEGHPDKMSDQISDAVLDALIKQDKRSRVACETFLTTGLALVGALLNRISIRERLSAIEVIGCPNPTIGHGDVLVLNSKLCCAYCGSSAIYSKIS